MKKRIMLLLGLMIFSVYMISGCAKPASDNAQDERENLTIITSFYPVYLHAINIAKDIPGVEVMNMTQPQVGCLHDYQLSPEDIKTLDGADIFIINGGGMESFMEKVLDQLDQLPIIDASQHIDLIEEDHPGHGEADDHHDHAFNPHVWVSVTGAIEQVGQIASELARLDPDNGAAYQANASAYIGKLEDLKEEMHASLDNIPNKNIVTFHEAFSYFAQEFDFNIVGTIITESGSEPSAKALSKVIEDIKTHKVKAVFTEPQFTSKAASLVSEEAGVGLYTLDPVVTGGPGQDEMDAYINTMKDNLRTLEEALR